MKYHPLQDAINESVGKIKVNHHHENAWNQSVLKPLRNLSSIRSRGARIEDIVACYLEARGFTIKESDSKDYDLEVNGKKVEIKGSLLSTGGTFIFNQIRDQDYDFLFLLGLTPYEGFQDDDKTYKGAYVWVIPKNDYMVEWAAGNIIGQHGGKSAIETSMLNVGPEDTGDWLSGWLSQYKDKYSYL